MDEVSNEELLAMLEEIGTEEGSGLNGNGSTEPSGNGSARGGKSMSHDEEYSHADRNRGGGGDVTDAQVMECVIQSLLAMEEAWEGSKIQTASASPATIGSILETYQSIGGDRVMGVPVDFLYLHDCDPLAARAIYQDPQRYLPLLDDGVRACVDHIVANQASNCKITLTNFFARLIMPCIPGALCKISDLRTSNFGKLVVVKGTVTRMSAPQLLEAMKTFQCTTCKECTVVHADLENSGQISPPRFCQSNGIENCTGTHFRPISEELEAVIDFQDLRLQESASDIPVGSVPAYVNSVLVNDLVDTVRAGDVVLITALCLRSWVDSGNLYPGTRPVAYPLLQALSIQVCGQRAERKAEQIDSDEKIFTDLFRSYKPNPLEFRDFVVKSMCPQIYGSFRAKFAVALLLASGNFSSDRATRDCSHLLLVGDPGTGKSQLMKFAAKVAAKAVITSGSSVSGAGLTCAAVKDSSRGKNGGWMLEAGALPLADGGICCIDEFDKVGKDDVAAMHEAMEQQTLSIAKAGLVTKLNTRVSVIAIMNPGSGGMCKEYDASKPLQDNIKLSSPLLSRFDIALVLKDRRDEELDSKVADHILGDYSGSHRSGGGELSIQELKRFFAFVQRFKPRMTKDAEEHLMRQYQWQRENQERFGTRTTLRKLESLIRLSKAHARILMRDEVLVIDVEEVCKAFED